MDCVPPQGERVRLGAELLVRNPIAPERVVADYCSARTDLDGILPSPRRHRVIRLSKYQFPRHVIFALPAEKKSDGPLAYAVVALRILDRPRPRPLRGVRAVRLDAVHLPEVVCRKRPPRAHGVPLLSPGDAVVCVSPREAVPPEELVGAVPHHGVHKPELGGFRECRGDDEAVTHHHPVVYSQLADDRGEENVHEVGGSQAHDVVTSGARRRTPPRRRGPAAPRRPATLARP